MTEREWLDIFGDNLVSLMRDRDVTQVELAIESGVSQASISAYINGRKMPGVRSLINLADALRVDMSEFMEFGDIID